jgi:hypothetical protein
LPGALLFLPHRDSLILRSALLARVSKDGSGHRRMPLSWFETRKLRSSP